MKSDDAGANKESPTGQGRREEEIEGTEEYKRRRGRRRDDAGAGCGKTTKRTRRSKGKTIETEAKEQERTTDFSIRIQESTGNK